MDFKSFNKNYILKEDNTGDTQEVIKKTAENYVRKGESELLNDILNMANENKKNGTLSESQLVEFENRVMPMLNEDQRTRLRSVLRMLRT